MLECLSLRPRPSWRFWGSPRTKKTSREHPRNPLLAGTIKLPDQPGGCERSGVALREFSQYLQRTPRFMELRCTHPLSCQWDNEILLKESHWTSYWRFHPKCWRLVCCRRFFGLLFPLRLLLRLPLSTTSQGDTSSPTCRLGMTYRPHLKARMQSLPDSYERAVG